MTQLLQKIDEENRYFSLQFEHTSIYCEDLLSFFLRSFNSPQNRISLGLETQLSDWEREKEALFQAFATEKLELIAANEAEIHYLKGQIGKMTGPRPQVIVAEEIMSDIEVQRASESFEVKIVPVETEIEPNRAFYTLFRTVSAHAEATNIDLDEAIAGLQRDFIGEKAGKQPFSVEKQPFSAGKQEKQVQTSFKYREMGLMMSMEEEISAVEGALRMEEAKSDKTESFERENDGIFELQYGAPSFDVSADRIILEKDTSDPNGAIRQLQTEPQEDLSVIQHYHTLEKDLEDEIRTNKLMQGQIQLLKEEIQQKDRQLMRLSEAKPQLNGEVLASAFQKLTKTLPNL